MKTVLAIGAHPDDIEIGCGGTLAKLHMSGHRIVHLVVTSGEEGCIGMGKDHAIAIREEEARRSAEVLGAGEITFFRAEDGLTGYSKELKVHTIALVRRVKPDIVFTHGASDQFSDHRIVHSLSLAAISAAAGPWYPDAGESPHQVQHIYGYEVWHPINTPPLTLDISTMIDRKLAALRCHESQIEQVNYCDAVAGLARYRGVMHMSGQYAEAFEVLKATL